MVKVKEYEEDEYEVVPTTPIRRLEQRMEKLESGSGPVELQRLIEQIIELIKSNQRVIDDVVKGNSELRDELSRIPGKIDSLIKNMNEFMDLLKAGAAEETVSEVSKETMGPLVSKFDELIEQNKKNLEVSQATLTSLSTMDKRLKRLTMQLGGYREE